MNAHCGPQLVRPLFRSTVERGVRRAARSLRLIGLLSAAVLLVTGCGLRGVHDVRLPGGADLGDDPYQVRIHFGNVLDLVPNAGVRVHNVPVGRVSDVRLADGTWRAEVVVQLNGDVQLPANATARLRQSSLLGEKYVDLSEPAGPDRATGRLTDGALIPFARTDRNPAVEEVLGAMSLLLNGGGVGQLQSITQELTTALDGRETDARELMHNLDDLVGSLDAQRDDITRALDSVNRLSAKLDQQRDSIDTALNDIEPGLRVLNQQRGQLVTMLRSLDELSGVATNVVDRSRADMVHDLEQLAPTLRELAKAGSDLPKSFELLLTFPFPDNAVDGIKGSDYTNLYADVDLNLSTIMDNLGRSQQPLIRVPEMPLPLAKGANAHGPDSDTGGTETPDDGTDLPSLRPERTAEPTRPDEPEPSDEADRDESDGLLGDVFGGG